MWLRRHLADYRYPKESALSSRVSYEYVSKPAMDVVRNRRPRPYCVK